MSDASLSIAHNLEEKERTSDVRLRKVSAFSNMILLPEVRKSLQKSGFVYPTHIQAAAIPVGKVGLDLLIQSKAGTGKTLIFSTIICEMYKPDVAEPQSLIVVPTREIAVQIESVLNEIGQYCRVFRCVSVIGGLDAAEDRKRLQGAKAIVGTPGRILHLLHDKVLNSSQIGILILDEADRMYTSNFRTDIDRICKVLPKQRQTIACSATFCNGLDEELAKKMQNPLFISTEEKASALVGIRQFAYTLREQKTSILEMESKLDGLRYIFGRLSFKQCLIFAGSQSRADSYRNYLERDGWPCELISGAQDQKTRLAIFKKFRENKIRILLATDLMARGIDSEHVNLVINMEVPTEMVTYLHRIGRAGRFGSHGIAISLLCSQKEHSTFRRLCSEVGGGMTVYKFPEEADNENNVNFWDFSNEKQTFAVYNSEAVEAATTEENKENNVTLPTDDSYRSSSIDTKTFQVNSKDSVFQLADIPPATSVGDSVAVPRAPEATLNVTAAESHHSSSQHLPSSNTIDDASSIAADSSHLEESEEPRLSARLPQLMNLLVDGSSMETEKNQNVTDFFDDYENAVEQPGDDDSSCCTKTDDPQMTMKKLNNFKALLYDTSAGHDVSQSKKVDIYSDYENFNGMDDSQADATCVSQLPVSSSEDSKATFVMSVDTPTNIQDSIEELQDDSMASNKRDTSYRTELESASEAKHFPSLQHPIGDVGKQHNLTVNRAAVIDILPAAAAQIIAPIQDPPQPAQEEVELGEDSDGSDVSSGFNENTTTVSSGIDTSDEEIADGRANAADESSHSYRSDESIPSDDGLEDDGDESDTSTEDYTESETSDSDEESEDDEEPSVMDEWIRLFNNQVQVIQDYVRITKSLRI